MLEQYRADKADVPIAKESWSITGVLHHVPRNAHDQLVQGHALTEGRWPSPRDRPPEAMRMRKDRPNGPDLTTVTVNNGI